MYCSYMFLIIHPVLSMLPGSLPPLILAALLGYLLIQKILGIGS